MTSSTSIKHVGFSGTRDGMTVNQRRELAHAWSHLAELGRVEVHHGCCTGADDEAGQLAHFLGFGVTAHPPTDKKLMADCAAHTWCEEKPYLDRNRDIVDDCDILYAAPKSLDSAEGGTWYTIRYAEKIGKLVVLLSPEGAEGEDIRDPNYTEADLRADIDIINGQEPDGA